MTKHINIYIFVAVLVIAITCIVHVATAQLTDPDTTSIESVKVFRHMLEANDTLMVVRYDVSYGNLTAQPTQGIDETFDFTYGNSSGNITGNVTAYPFFNYGYAKGLVVFYWEGNTTTQPPWGDLGNITIEGDAALFSAPVPSDTYTLVSTDYSTYTSPADIREDLRQYLVSQLSFIDMDWNNWYADQGYTDRQLDLLVEIPPDYIVLSSTGEAYMTNVWEYTRDACPLLYLLQIYTPTHTEGNHTLAQQNIYETLHTDDYVGNATAAGATLMGGIAQTWFSTVIGLVVALGIIIICQWKWQKANIGMLIGYAVILLSTQEGLFQMGLMALGAVIAVLVIVWTFFWSRSYG